MKGTVFPDAFSIPTLPASTITSATLAPDLDAIPSRIFRTLAN